MGRFDDFKNNFSKSMDDSEAMQKKMDADRESMGFKYATGNKITPMSLIDQFTGAPTRAAVEHMQKGNFDRSVFEKALEAASRDPSLAPTGGDIAKNMGVDDKTMGGKALGLGYDLALDPTNLIPSKGGFAAMGAMGKISDIAKAEKMAQEVKNVERAKGVLGANKYRDMSKVADVEKNVKSAEELVKESNAMARNPDQEKFGRVMQLGDKQAATSGSELLAKPDIMRSSSYNAKDPMYDAMAPQKQAIVEKLQSLGATPEQIAEAFRKKGL